MKKPQTVGERILKLRTDLGLSQRDLGSPGVTYAFISRIEAGSRTPSAKALRKIADRFNEHDDKPFVVTPLWLATGKFDQECPYCGRS